MNPRRCHLALALVLALTSVVSAHGQVTQHDTGVTTTSDIAGGVFTPAPGGGAGTVAADASPAVTAAVTVAATTVVTQLSTGTMTAIAPSGESVTVPAPTQAAVLAVVTGGAAPAEITAALATSGAEGAAVALTDALSGLISNPAPGQLAAAVGYFNTLVMGSSDAFLLNPPAEFLAVMSVLAQLTAASQSAQD